MSDVATRSVPQHNTLVAATHSMNAAAYLYLYLYQYMFSLPRGPFDNESIDISQPVALPEGGQGTRPPNPSPTLSPNIFIIQIGLS